ncbi:MAG: AI-2E family transporter [Longimicrobiales bacterium]
MARAEGPEAEYRIRLPLGQVARAALVAIALWALANLVWLGRDLLFLAFFATLFALFLGIFVDRLEPLGVPRPVGVGLVLVALAALAVGFWFLFWPPLEAQLGLVRTRVPEVIAGIEAWVRANAAGVFGPMERGQLEATLQERLRAQANDLMAGALPLLNTVIGVLLGVFIVIFAGVYLAIRPGAYIVGAERLLPPRFRGRVAHALGESGRNLRRWMIGVAVSMTLIGALSTLGLWLLDVPAPLALGLLAGLLQFIPTYGPLISAVPAIAMGLLVSPATALYVLLLYAGIQLVETNLITPKVMQETAELPPALTILFQTLMGILFGFLGLLLAVPILAAVMVLAAELYVEPLENHERAT